MVPSSEALTDMQRNIFNKISKNDVYDLMNLMTPRVDIDFVDENGMSPLQHACYKGNMEIVQMLLDQVGYVILVERRAPSE